MVELNKTIQDLKMEIESIEKSQWKTTLEIENLRKRLGVIDASITNRIQDRISRAEDSTENIERDGQEHTRSLQNSK